MTGNLLTTDFAVIETGGTPYGCGHRYGQVAGEQIRQNVEVYYRLFEFRAHLSRDAARQKAERYLPAIEACNADLVAEMRGVADGAGVSLLEIVMLNARTELLETVPLPECTSLAALPPASSGAVWLAQNWDWLVVTHPAVLVLKIAQTGKPALTLLVEAGQIGKMGLNEAGVGLGLNWLEVDYHRIGVPVLLVCREILNQANIADAINAVLKARRRGAAANFLIGYRDGVAVDLETTPDDFDFLEPVGGLLVHTNHFISPRFRAIDHGLRDERGGSLVRRQRAQYLLEREPVVDGAAIARVLADTACAPSSIFQSPDRADHECDQWATLATISANLSSGEMRVTARRFDDESPGDAGE